MHQKVAGCCRSKKHEEIFIYSPRAIACLVLLCFIILSLHYFSFSWSCPIWSSVNPTFSVKYFIATCFTFESFSWVWQKNEKIKKLNCGFIRVYDAKFRFFVLVVRSLIILFLRKVTIGGKQYIRLVENYREDGKVKQRFLATLRRVDQISKEWALNMIEKLRAWYDVDDVVNMSNVESNVIKNYGAKLVVDKLFEEYELDEYLSKVDKKVRYDLESMIKLMVMNRLLEPKSKLGIYNNWITTDLRKLNCIRYTGVWIYLHRRRKK